MTVKWGSRQPHREITLRRIPLGRQPQGVVLIESNDGKVMIILNVSID